jgi:hypothetical protein
MEKSNITCMNIYKIKLLIHIQENLFKTYMHYKNYITYNLFMYIHYFICNLMLS